MGELRAKEYKRFEDIRHVRPGGGEYWLARELAPVLDYTQWRNFAKVMDKAMIACKNSGHDVIHDFAEVSKIVDAGATSKPVTDYELSRYACYLIVQNGDPRKEVIALGQTYFAIQTYRQEIADRFNRMDEDSRRLVVRGDIKQWNQMLAEAARDAGVISNEEFAIFQNAGYMGLYGGLAVEDIHIAIPLCISSYRYSERPPSNDAGRPRGARSAKAALRMERAAVPSSGYGVASAPRRRAEWEAQPHPREECRSRGELP